MENQGNFKGSPITGLAFRTPTLTGLTDKSGAFKYLEGESLSFSMGDLVVGSAKGKEKLTLIDIVPGATDFADQRVVNLCVLLQTLDKDGDLKNGIQITPEISEIASGFSGRINFDQSPKVFKTDPHVAALLGKLNAAKVFPDTGSFGMRRIRNATAARAFFEADMESSSLQSVCHKVVQTANGRVNGYSTSNSTYTWLGIPYAKPPMGDLRWKPPQAAEPWEGIRDCTQWGDQCGQGDLGPVSFGNLSENCLNLNVVAPANTGGKRLPVMVWFHGGGFHAMSANNMTYNYTALPGKGVIIVTVNHRLGPLGYMAHPALSAESEQGVSGNYGQLDLIAALKWVKENIAAFGGDSDCVTLFGESGGGGKTFNLILSPLAKGLFHRAIIQSGLWSIRDLRGQRLPDAEARGERLVKEMGISKEEDVLNTMREKTWQEVVGAGQKINFADLRLITIDNWYLPDDEENVFKRKLHNDVPVIMGANRTDMDFGMVEGIKEWGAVMSENSKSKIFIYLFGHVPARWRKEGVVAFHGLEIPYVFGCVQAGLGGGTVAGLARTGGAKQPDPGIDETDDRISEYMMAMWVQFAKTGDPNMDGKVGGMTAWEAYDAKRDNFLFICDEDDALQMQTGIVEHYEPPPAGTPPLIPVK
ncbi:MAG: carboxylesterase family protein [Proteobacteria bacterium]|nr:carboxylesterase family protein [Pseudomonadota bacterium]MBU4468880.1 carboxylesterase family protein [Pseudomonadota bacterium]MCG2750873.1 carboxylesterase family protein [Desulfobacteraceae bacterium]